MKALGIVRKIDHLGRIVIPKEVRDTNGWDSGQSMEMFMNDGGITLKPYGSTQEKESILTQLETVKNFTENDAAKKMIQDAIAFIKK